MAQPSALLTASLAASTAHNQRVAIELIKTKCIPILLYGTEACNLRKAQISSLDFVVTRFGMKVLQTSDRNKVIERFGILGLSLPSELITRRVNKFIVKFGTIENTVCANARLLPSVYLL